MESITNMKEEVCVEIKKNKEVNVYESSKSENSETSEVKKEVPLKKKKSKKVRCFICKKNCGLMQFNCDCGNIFCSKHVTRISHNCIKINENSEKKKKDIEKSLPLTEPSKITKI